MSLLESKKLCYRIENTEEIFSPALVLFREILAENLTKMCVIADNPKRLRPHCKTHKTREIIELELQQGIDKHKCATFAEAEMLAEAGVTDIFLAYNLVGPNIERAVKFVKKFPDIKFAITVDHPKPAVDLSRAMESCGRNVQALLDLDTGQHRTGLPVGDSAKQLYRKIVDLPGLTPGGIHLYDGQNHQTPLRERTAAVRKVWETASAFRDELVSDGFSVPQIVAGGTGSFPIFAKIEDPTIQLSPGTCVFHDAGYAEMFPDLDFTPAALILTRVISRPTSDRMTLDLGYKAVASDPPAGRRHLFPDLPNAEEVLQNEEHLVLQTPQAEKYQPGDSLLAIPQHACPTSAVHKHIFVISHGKLSEKWEVRARDRCLTI